VRLRLAAALLFMPVLLNAQDPGCSDDHPFFTHLEQMVTANSTVSYRAVAVLEVRGEEARTLRIEHRVIDGVETDLVEPLDAAEHSLVRQGHPVDCGHPGHRALRAGLVGASCRLLEQYDLRSGPGGELAGRQSIVLRFAPRDLYRYGYVMYVDAETGLLLAQDTVSPRGELLERFRVQALELTGDAPIERLPVDGVHQLPASHMPGSSPPVSVPADPWQAGWVPPGFTPVSDGITDGVRTYTNGLAVFSVALEALPPQMGTGEGVAREGSMLSYARGVVGTGDPYLVVVVGELPLYAARMIANGIQFPQ